MTDSYVIYETTTGRVVELGIGDIPEIPTDRRYARLLGVRMGDPSRFRVDLSTRTLVDLPPRPSEDHEFDYTAKVWKLDRERAAWRARFERDRRLTESDWTQLPDIPDATKLKWQAYRQALRDVTAQPGFPERIEWPVAPG